MLNIIFILFKILVRSSNSNILNRSIRISAHPEFSENGHSFDIKTLVINVLHDIKTTINSEIDGIFNSYDIIDTGVLSAKYYDLNDDKIRTLKNNALTKVHTKVIYYYKIIQRFQLKNFSIQFAVQFLDLYLHDVIIKTSAPIISILKKNLNVFLVMLISLE